MKKFLLTLCLVFVFGFVFVNQAFAVLSDGSEHPTFNQSFTNSGNGEGFRGDVRSIIEQPDKKILIGGYFRSLNGVTRKDFTRLNSNGSEDTNFANNLGLGFNRKTTTNNGLTISYSSGLVWTSVLQSNGQILVGGAFDSFNGNDRGRIVRLNSDGTEDAIFATNVGKGIEYSDNFVAGGPTVLDIDVDPTTGDIILVGQFYKFNGKTRNNIVRLNSDGTEDVDFYTNVSLALGGALPNTITFRSDGKMYIGVGGESVGEVILVNNDGTRNNSFNTQNFIDNSIAQTVSFKHIFIQSDGKLLVGGQFTKLGGNNRGGLVRLNQNGSEDGAFGNNLGTGFNNIVQFIDIDSSGRIIVSGNFTTFNSANRGRLVFLNPNGIEDINTVFNLGTGFNNIVWEAKVLSDQDILVGGAFSSFNYNIPRGKLVKLSCCGVPPTPPVVDLSTTTPNVNSGGYTGLSWTVTGPTATCTATSTPNVLIWNGNKTPVGSGSQNGVGPINQETTFTLTCTGPGGEGSDTETITVNPNAPTINFYATPSSVTTTNKTTTLHWSVEDATSCSASSNPGTTWNGSRTFAITEKTENVTLENPTTFKLTCTGPGGDSEASVSVGILSLPNFNFTASSPVAYENATYITWDSVTNATACTASSNNANSNWSGSVSISGGSKFSNLLTQNTIFTLSCTGSGGTTTKDVEVKVGPKITLNANPLDIAKGGGTDLTWTTLNATSCTASSIPSSTWNGSRPLNSTIPEKVLNINENTEFKLTCENSGRVPASAVVLVKVTPVPTVSFSASTTKVLPGGFVDLTLETTNADSCIASSNPSTTWVGNKPVNQIHTERILDINAKTTFTIVCSSLGGVISREVVVDLIAEKLTFNNTKVLRDSSTGQYKTTLSWVLTNMTGCKASTKNPTSGLVWGDTYINIPDSPTSNSKSNVLVTAPDTNDKTKKNEYILSCFGKNSGKPATASLFLDINDLASSGFGIPDYEEN